MAADQNFNVTIYDEQIFNEDLLDVHLSYDYDAKDAQGNPEKWRYELWFPFKVNFLDMTLDHTLIISLGSLRVQDSWRTNGRPEQLSDLQISMHKAPRTVAVQLVGRLVNAVHPSKVVQGADNDCGRDWNHCLSGI